MSAKACCCDNAVIKKNFGRPLTACVFGVCLFFLGRKLKKVDKKGLVPLG
jgi:hypothetical protein